MRLISFLACLLANSQVLIKILSKFFLPILLDRKRKGNKIVFDKKISFKAVFLIFLLYNFSENTFLLFLLYLLIVLSSFCLFIAKLNINIFGKDNLGIVTDNLGIVVNNLSKTSDNSSIVINNPSKVANNLNIRIDVNAGANNLGIATNNSGTTEENSGIKSDTNIKAEF